MAGADPLQAFQQAQPLLLGLAYRILGVYADAEDVVQECFLKWQASDRDDVHDPTAWLASVCTRHCLDVLRLADRARVEYVGTWLPEPVRTGSAPGAGSSSAVGPAQRFEREALLSTAFLLALQRLTPRERAAYLLREIFEMPYAQVAATLDLAEPACRQLVSRARTHLARGQVRHETPPATQRRLLAAFAQAITTGSVEALAALLSDEVRLSADGGGKVIAARRVLHGRGEVLRFVQAGLHRWWRGYVREEAMLNGQLGWVLRSGPGVEAAVTFGYDPDGRLADVFVMRNPDKLQAVAAR